MKFEMPTTSTRGAQPAAVDRRHGERHVAAVAAARDHHPRGVELRPRADPVEQRADVLDRVLALHAVVEADEGLAEADRAAHVGIDDRDAQLVEEVVVASDERRARLALGAAVDVDDHRPLAGEPRRRLVVEAGNLQPVEALPADQFRLRQVRGDQAAELALGPARDRAGRRVERVDIRRRARAGHRERQLAVVAVPRQRPDARRSARR